jgi:hypothetical protein
MVGDDSSTDPLKHVKEADFVFIPAVFIHIEGGLRARNMKGRQESAHVVDLAGRHAWGFQP